MNEPRPPAWAEALLTLWVLVVGVIYFGGYFVPAVGALTPAGAAFYALMVLAAVLTLAFRYLRRNQPSGGKGGDED